MEFQFQQPLSTFPDPSRIELFRILKTASAVKQPDTDFELLHTAQEQVQLQQLRNRDREVRSHEAAHKIVAGRYATGAPTFQYQRGPNGQYFAVGGQVRLDTSAVANDPEATFKKMDTIRRAALAPSNPSAQDISVAARASQLAARARIEIAIQRRQDDSELFTGREESTRLAALDEFTSPKPSGNLVSTFA